jgi:hypothetical protein
MKPSTLAIIVLLPTIGAAQGTPDTGNSKLWEMRKKVQQRNAQRAGSYLEQMNQSLTDGDSAGAESALKSAIAQGTLTQPQIDDARGRIAALVSRQQQEMVAAARAKAEAESRAAEAQRVAEAQAVQSKGGVRMTGRSQSGNTGVLASGDKAETELSRFAKRHNGGLWNFTVARDYMDGTIVLKNAEGKQWQVSYSASVLPSSDNYNKGKTGGLTLNNESLVGARMSVEFHGDGTPVSIKNLDNGNTSRVRTWKVTGFGW